MALKLVAATEQDLRATTRDHHHVVGHEAMPAFHQIEHALRLADAAASDEQESNAEDVGQRRVQRRRRREFLLEPRLDAAVELVGLETRSDDRHAGAGRQLHHLRGRLLALRDEHRRDREREERAEDLPTLHVGPRQQIADLRLAEDLEPMRREALDVPREHESRTGDIRADDLALQSVAAQGLEREDVAKPLNQSADGELGLHAVASLRRARDFAARLRADPLRRACFARAICAPNLPNATVSAGPKCRASPRATNRRPRGAYNTSSTRRVGPSSSTRTTASTARPRRATILRSDVSARCCKRGEISA